jgi:hypothetical protein
MFGMSLADMCSSTAMALTSLPMPSYMPKEEIFGYHWAGTRLGNTYTCNAQGFFVSFGMAGMYTYNSVLCLYYVCALAFTMKDKVIKKRIEPFMHGIAIVVSLISSLPPLFYDMYNPTTSGYAWCGPVPYPNECSYMEDVECIRGNDKMEIVNKTFLSGSILFLFAFVSLSFLWIIWKVNQTDRDMKRITKNYRVYGFREVENVLEKHNNITKIVVIQAFFYVAAILLTVFPPLLLMIGGSGFKEKALVNLEKTSLVLLPLQGFYNFVIFLSHKVYNYRRVHAEKSVWHVLALLFCTSTCDPCFISRISLVKQYADEEEQEQQQQRAVQESGGESDDEIGTGLKRSDVYDLNIHDESDKELHYRLELMDGGGTNGKTYYFDVKAQSKICNGDESNESCGVEDGQEGSYGWLSLSSRISICSNYQPQKDPSLEGLESEDEKKVRRFYSPIK